MHISNKTRLFLNGPAAGHNNTYRHCFYIHQSVQSYISNPPITRQIRIDGLIYSLYNIKWVSNKVRKIIAETAIWNKKILFVPRILTPLIFILIILKFPFRILNNIQIVFMVFLTYLEMPGWCAKLKTVSDII